MPDTIEWTNGKILRTACVERYDTPILFWLASNDSKKCLISKAVWQSPHILKVLLCVMRTIFVLWNCTTSLRCHFAWWDCVLELHGHLHCITEVLLGTLGQHLPHGTWLMTVLILHFPVSGYLEVHEAFTFICRKLFFKKNFVCPDIRWSLDPYIHSWFSHE